MKPHSSHDAFLPAIVQTILTSIITPEALHFNLYKILGDTKKRQ